MRGSLAVFLGVCIVIGCVWRAGGGEPTAPAAEPDQPALRPVTIAVVDADAKKPVGKFSFRYRFSKGTRDETPTSGDWTEWKTVDPPEGAVRVETPRSGDFLVEAKADGFVGLAGPVASANFALHEAEESPEFVVNVHRSVTIRGIVLDKSTRRPVTDASVAPTIYTRPGTEPRNNPVRAVQTDEHGRFEMPFCDAYLGYSAWHDDYEMVFSKRDPFGDARARLDRTKPVEVTIELTAKQRVLVRGTVTSADGKPMGGVRITDETKSNAASNADGSFAIYCGRARSGGPYKLEFAAPGYFARSVSFDAIPARGLAILLKSGYHLVWNVVTPEGKPAPRFKFSLGLTKSPPTDGCIETEVDNPQGEIRLAVGDSVEVFGDYSEFLGGSPRFWVGIRAEGCAVWEEVVTADDLTRPRTIRLQTGATVSGSIVSPGAGLDTVRAILAPQRLAVESRQRPMQPLANDAASRRFGRLEAVAARDGIFRFEHVRPDAYTLDVSGTGIAPIHRLVVVPDADVRLEPLLAKGTGRIVGDAGAKWASKSGWIEHASGIPSFGEDHIIAGSTGHSDARFSVRADANGRFSADGIPAGLLTVGFTDVPFDVIHEDLREVRVVEGQETEVRFFDTSGEWTLPLDIVVGDGSARQLDYATRPLTSYTFRHDFLNVRLEAKPGQPASYPPMQTVSLKAGPDRRTAARNVSPGKYRMRVYAPRAGEDLGLGRIPLLETDVEVKPNGASVRIELGAGAILGRMPPEKVNQDKGRVFVLPEAGPRPIRDNTHYAGASFEVRFVPPGKYSLVAWDAERSRFSRLDAVAVNAETPARVQMPPWSRGGTITGRVGLSGVHPLPLAVTATDSRGVCMEPPGFQGVVGEQFTIAGLWPDSWTLSLCAGDEVLATAKVTLRGTETTQADLGNKP